MANVFPVVKGSPIATGDLLSHINVVINGKACMAMQAFVNQLNKEQSLEKKE
ncbi:hypothetical protein [Vibrio sp.]|uniref:hypothetical protein n=1 Tax=Vibrio sp. TaxID=678 RepID=UPI003AA924F5